MTFWIFDERRLSRLNRFLIWFLMISILFAIVIVVVGMPLAEWIAGMTTESPVANTDTVP